MISKETFDQYPEARQKIKQKKTVGRGKRDESKEMHNEEEETPSCLVHSCASRDSRFISFAMGTSVSLFGSRRISRELPCSWARLVRARASLRFVVCASSVQGYCRYGLFSSIPGQPLVSLSQDTSRLLLRRPPKLERIQCRKQEREEEREREQE